MTRTESHSQGYRLAAVVEGFPQGHRISPSAQTDRKIDPNLCRNHCAPQGVSRTQEGAFFFRKKAYCGNQTTCVAESRKSVQT